VGLLAGLLVGLLAGLLVGLLAGLLVGLLEAQKILLAGLVELGIDPADLGEDPMALEGEAEVVRHHQVRGVVPGGGGGAFLLLYQFPHDHEEKASLADSSPSLLASLLL